MERTCLDCGEILLGRADKKFCSDQCRNNYNNRLNSDSNNYIRKVNHIIRKNRRIIAELTPTGKSKVGKAQLTSRGFDFKFYTNIYTTKAGGVYYFCYEYGYLPLDGDFYALVKREEYLR